MSLASLLRVIVAQLPLVEIVLSASTEIGFIESTALNMRVIFCIAVKQNCQYLGQEECSVKETLVDSHVKKRVKETLVDGHVQKKVGCFIFFIFE